MQKGGFSVSASSESLSLVSSVVFTINCLLCFIDFIVPIYNRTGLDFDWDNVHSLSKVDHDLALETMVAVQCRTGPWATLRPFAVLCPL